MARWVALTLAFTFFAPLSFAEQSDLERRAAEEFRRAERYFNAEDYLSAAEHFERANELVPVSSVHYNIARSYELAGLRELAAQHYRAFLDARAGNPQRRRQLEERLRALSEGLGWVRVETEPTGARVSADGQARGAAPLTLALEIGSHDVEARSEDGGVAARTIEVGEGEMSIQLSLRSEAADELEDEPVDDEVTIGESHQLGVTRGEEPIPREPERSSVRRLHHGFFWAGLGLTIASGVALAVVGNALIDKRLEYERLPYNDPNEARIVEEGQRLEAATTALWVSTGVLLGATILFAIFTDWSALRRGDRRDRSSSPVQPRWSLSLARELSLGLSF